MKLKKFLSVFMSALMLMSALCFGVSAAGDGDLKELDQSEYYGISALKSMPNSDGLVFAYNRIAEGMESLEGRIFLGDDTHSISVDEIGIVFKAYYNDYPQHFWVSGSYRYFYNETNTVQSIQPTYIFEGEALDRAKQLVEAAASELLSGIDMSMSEFEREKLIHDRLCDYVTYDLDADNAHNIIGSLGGKSAVCDGYAKAFQYLLYRAGIQSHIVSGTAAGGGHAWNLVRIDGRYYYADITWDDQTDHTYNAYLNITTSELEKDHVIKSDGYPLPECTAQDANYYVVTESIIDPLDADKIAGIMRKSGKNEAEIYVNASRTDFSAWLNQNLKDIAEKAGITGAYYGGYSCLGNVYFVYINASSGVSLSGTVTSYGSENDEIVITLIPSGSLEAAYRQTVKGEKTGKKNKLVAEYNFREIAPGSYTVVVSKNKHIDERFDILVSTNTVKDCEIFLKRDINHDGVFNGYEMIILVRYLAGWNVTVNEEYFDLNGDGGISAYEVIMYSRYFAGWRVDVGE